MVKGCVCVKECAWGGGGCLVRDLCGKGHVWWGCVW